jgi:hypothetical protein
MFKVHQLHPPEQGNEPMVRSRVIDGFAEASRTTYWRRAATRIMLPNGEYIYVREGIDDVERLWLRIDASG